MRVSLVFTRDVSLRVWDGGGMLEREFALYRRLQEKGVAVDFLTYGNAGDRAYASRLPGVRLLCNRWGLPRPVYAALAPWIHGSVLAGTTVIKSNQVLGAEVALAAARRHGKPFVARCGYLHSDFMERAHGKDSRAARRAAALERMVFEGAARVVVTTEAMRQQVAERYGIGSDRLRVIPNYVDTFRFRPSARVAGRRVCFVGRLVEQKDPFLLVESMRGLGAELIVAGDGHLRPGLEAEARRSGVAARFLGTVRNEELPEVLARCSVFVLPSRYEGHPKTLIEAMACGLAVVGADSPGIREVIRDGETGLLCRPAGLRDAIARLLDDAGLRARLGAAARRFAEGNFALDRVAETEHRLLLDLAGAPA